MKENLVFIFFFAFSLFHSCIAVLQKKITRWTNGNPLVFYPWEKDHVTNSMHYKVVADEEKAIHHRSSHSLCILGFCPLGLFERAFDGLVTGGESLFGGVSHHNFHLLPDSVALASALNMENTFDPKNCFMLSLFNPTKPHLKLVNCQQKLLKYFVCEKLQSFSHSLLPVELKIHSASISGSFVPSANSNKKYGIWKCQSGHYISSAGVCDGTSDCSDRSDESNCQCIFSGIKINDSVECSQYCSVKIKCICSVLFTKHKDGIYFSFVNKLPIFRENVKNSSNDMVKMYQCQKSSVYITTTLINDLVFDCPSFDDENQLMESSVESHVCEDNMLECYPGHSQCYTVPQKCNYNITRHTQTLMYCRNGKHLQDCDATHCDGMFKCPDTYCVPHRYVCNGMWDCWSGEDEMICTAYCNRRFKCKMYLLCLDMMNVCDGILDCPLNDDELTCDQLSCFHGCRCLNYGLRCHQENRTADDFFLVFLVHFVFVSISESKLPDGKVNELIDVLILVCHENNLTSPLACDSSGPDSKMKYLDLSFNNIVKLENENFYVLVQFNSGSVEQQ